MKGCNTVKENTKQIKILYTSDVHGNATPILYGSNEQVDLGLVKYTTAVKEIKARHEDVILIDNGDLIQGTPFMTHYVKSQYSALPNPMISLMNEINIDAAVIGNHEFNFGKEVLDKATEESTFPWLSANVLSEATGEPYFGTPYIIKEMSDGIKVAIVGVTTHYIPNWESPHNIEGMQFYDALITLKKWVKYIQDTEQPDVMIASYHGGFESDINTGDPTEALTGENQGYKMCEEIEGIDVLLTGHQHRELIGKVNDVLVIQPGKNGQKYGEIDLMLECIDNTWKLINKSASLQSLTNVKSDPKALTMIKGLEASTQEWLDQPIGNIIGDMTIQEPFKARISKHPFIEFIQKVQMDAGGVDISTVSLFNNDTDGFSSRVTMREVVSNYMYPNTLVVLALKGKDIIAALEKSAEYFIIDTDGEIAVNPIYMEPKPQHYNYDMWEGINYIIRVSNPIGARIENISYHDQPLEDNEIYHVALNNYRAGGGGDFPMFKDKPIVKDIQIDTVELIRAYFEKHEDIQATTTENFKVIK